MIIPTHNRVDCLPTALASVLRQTWSDLEVLVVDDASTDGTAEYLARFPDPRVRVVRLDRQQGAGGARNEGLKRLRNEWIAFQDSDDCWAPRKLEKQMAAADRSGPELGVVYCRCRRGSGRGGAVFPPLRVPAASGMIFDALLGGNLVSTQTALVRRAHVER